MEKIKISPFEFVIMQYSDPEAAKLYEPYTDKEIREQRTENIKRQMSQIKVFKLQQTPDQK